ncbi:MAG: Sec-independent protein translocase TatA [Pseudomonadota bacterium]
MGLGGIHPLQLLIVLALVLLFFGGRGKISALMGDMAKGVKSFRQGLKDEDAPADPKPINQGDTIDATATTKAEDTTKA